MNQIELTPHWQQILEQRKDLNKRNLGGVNIEECISENEKFDRRKFGKLDCPFCKRQFNPLYVKSYKAGEWDSVWVNCDHKQPELHCEVNCPTCNEHLSFYQYIPQ